MINGSFWIGAVGGALLTIPLLDPTLVNPAIGWRLAFGLGAILALGVLIVRRHVPESPRWLFIHGREDDGERIVADIEDRVQGEDGELPEPSGTITVRQRRSIGIALIARSVFTRYPRLCIAFFYAIGTAAGGIAGPLLFGALIENASGSGDITKIALGYFIGAALMVAGGLVEAIFGVKAERQALEHIATPLTVEDATEAESQAGRPA